MSRPEAVRVDPARGRIEWMEDGTLREAFVAGAEDARYDPEGGRLIVLVRNGERGAVAILSRGGNMVTLLPPPEGYRLSHFAGAGLVLVGQGEAAIDGWQDWHFAPGEDGLERLGPAY